MLKAEGRRGGGAGVISDALDSRAPFKPHETSVAEPRNAPVRLYRVSVS